MHDKQLQMSKTKSFTGAKKPTHENYVQSTHTTVRSLLVIFAYKTNKTSWSRIHIANTERSSGFIRWLASLMIIYWGNFTVIGSFRGQGHFRVPKAVYPNTRQSAFFKKPSSFQSKDFTFSQYHRHNLLKSKLKTKANLEQQKCTFFL